MARLAKSGIIAAIGSTLYQDMRGGNQQAAQRMIKDFTRHNDKLGADFVNTTRRYKLEHSPQFSVSAYSEFVKAAAEFQKKYNPTYGNFLSA